jgi:[acyl-carrier-protein] S-malonyltransferase
LSIVSSAQPQLEAYLDKWLKESFLTPVISNVTARAYQTKNEATKLLSVQLVSPVKYKQSILAVESSVDCFIEFGGSVLKGLNKRITQKPTYSITDMKSLEEVLALL